MKIIISRNNYNFQTTYGCVAYLDNWFMFLGTIEDEKRMILKENTECMMKKCSDLYFMLCDCNEFAKISARCQILSKSASQQLNSL